MEQLKLQVLCMTLCCILLQKATFDAYVEFPLMFTIQDESLSAFYQANVAARQQALGHQFDQQGPNFIVRFHTS